MNTNLKAVLTCLSCVGVAGSIALAINDTNKHVDEKLTIKEYSKKYWKDYIPTLVVGTATITAITTNHIITTKDVKKLSAFALGSTALLADYKNEIKEQLGDDGYKNIVKGVAERRAGVQLADGHTISIQNLCSTSTDISQEPDTLFYDEFSDTWFYSTLYNVKNAMYHFNRNFTLKGDVSIDEFYDFLGVIPKVPWPKDLYGFGNNLLEDGIYWVDFDICECRENDGEQFYTIFYQFEPVEYNEQECTYAYPE